MARNTKVEADHNAPPITQLLAKFAVAMSELLVERLRDTARRV